MLPEQFLDDLVQAAEAFYEPLSRAQRRQFWQMTLQNAADEPIPATRRRSLLRNSWRWLSALEPAVSTLPAEMLAPYFDLQDRLAAEERAALEELTSGPQARQQPGPALAPRPDDGEAPGLRSMPVGFEWEDPAAAEAIGLEIAEFLTSPSHASPEALAVLARELETGYRQIHGPLRGRPVPVRGAAEWHIRWLRHWLGKALGGSGAGVCNGP